MFALVSLAVFTIVLPHVSNAAFCDYIKTKDCNFASDPGKVCGTNGQTYRNSCYLAKAYCGDGNVHKAHDGECAPPTTTPLPVDGASIALDIFCLDLDYITCPTAGPQVCGSDGKFYGNLCEFDKTRCYHRDLHANGQNCS